MTFIDEAFIHVQGGRGGNGCVAFRREKFVPRGGPSGGDGGHGGSVFLVGDEGLNTLFHLRFRSLYAAKRGRHGEGSNRTGRSGEDLVIRVPLGTQVFDPETDEMMDEVLAQDQQLEVARGGRGGRGNARFTTATRQAPRHAEPGESGLERRLRLELKLLADVGVVGLPNAGKSTLISVISAARPKIADYPFTTLIPFLGVVADEIGGEPFVVADLPGLIAGAADGAGLGTQFLRHVERCRILVHLVDLSTAEKSASEDFQTVERELRAIDRGLEDKESLIVGSKVDAVRQERREELERLADRRGCTYLEISSVTGQGLPALIAELGRRLQQEKDP